MDIIHKQKQLNLKVSSYKEVKKISFATRDYDKQAKKGLNMIHYVHHHPIVISFNKLILQKDFCEFSPMASCSLWFTCLFQQKQTHQTSCKTDEVMP